MIKSKIKIQEIKKYLKSKIFDLKKNKRNNLKENNLESILRTFLASLIIITGFFITPIVLEFTKERRTLSANFENNSKNEFNKTLEGKSSKSDNKLNDKFVFDDILEFDNSSTNSSDSVRLSASTIEQLFLDTGYNLNDVRKEKFNFRRGRINCSLNDDE